MHTLRQTSGLAGFPKRDESIHDAFGAGHSSTSISAGLGMSYILLIYSLSISEGLILMRDTLFFCLMNPCPDPR